MPRPETAALALLLAACARDPITVAPGASLVAAPIGTELRLTLTRNRSESFAFLEELAARCWLDDVLMAGGLLVDRRGERLVLSTDDTDRLAADLLPGLGLGQVRLSGPALDEPATRARLLETLNTADRTGETACPPHSG
ncbi:MAG: hypothetical protein AAF713_07680 [Pseudomonadota bacterium]